MPRSGLAVLQDFTSNYILNTGLEKNRTDLLEKLMPEDKWPWESEVAGGGEIAEVLPTDEIRYFIDDEHRLYDQLDWLDAVRAISPGTPGGAVLDSEPRKTSLQQHRRTASKMKKCLTKMANMVAKTLTKDLGLPEEMEPKVLSCLRTFEDYEMEAVGGLDYAELRCAVLEQHRTESDDSESSASS